MAEKVRNGVMPWTLVIADFLEKGREWDKQEVADCLRRSQAKIDELTAQLEKQNGNVQS